jgi:hypothetical protein
LWGGHLGQNGKLQQSETSIVKKNLELPNGILSHDTFARVFARLNPEQFQNCFLD